MHPWENPKRPLETFVNGSHDDPKFGVPYNTWSCKEPPTLIRSGLKATRTRVEKEYIQDGNMLSHHIMENNSIFFGGLVNKHGIDYIMVHFSNTSIIH